MHIRSCCNRSRFGLSFVLILVTRRHYASVANVDKFPPPKKKKKSKGQLPNRYQNIFQETSSNRYFPKNRSHILTEQCMCVMEIIDFKKCIHDTVRVVRRNTKTNTCFKILLRDVSERGRTRRALVVFTTTRRTTRGFSQKITYARPHSRDFSVDFPRT